MHRALGDPTRARLVERLRRSERPLDASELAGELGLHPNTVRAHLEVLEDVGLVHSEPEHRERPGRPRRLFVAVRDQAEEEHGILAAALAGALEPIAEGVELAEAAGRGWGRRLASAEGNSARQEPDPLRRVVGLLGARGFEPEECDDGIVMHRCPFRGLAEQHPRVVCGFHAGLIDGALAELDAPVELAVLHPWDAQDRCVAHLRARRAS